MKAYTLDIILPCYNPQKGWVQELLLHLAAFRAQLGDPAVHLIVVNDGATVPIAQADIDALQQAYPDTSFVAYAENKGKGYAIRKGVAHAKAPLQIYTDIDFPFQISCMIAAYEALQNGADVVLGNRKASYQLQLKTKRKLLSFGSHIFNKYILGLRYIDTQGGLKGFNARGKAVFERTIINRYLFDTEFILRCVQQRGLHLHEITIETRPGIHLSEMGINILQKELFNLFRLLKIRLFKK